MAAPPTSKPPVRPRRSRPRRRLAVPARAASRAARSEGQGGAGGAGWDMARGEEKGSGLDLKGGSG